MAEPVQRGRLVAGTGPVHLQHPDVGQRIAERADLPVEHGEDVAVVADHAVVEPVVAVDDGRRALFRDAAAASRSCTSSTAGSSWSAIAATGSKTNRTRRQASPGLIRLAGWRQRLGPARQSADEGAQTGAKTIFGGLGVGFLIRY